MNNKVYDYVTERMIALLEKGTVPWRKPWTGQVPANFVTRKAYRGMNLFLLGYAPFGSPFWMTYKQAESKGGSIRKGEKSSMVIFWKFLETDKIDAKGNKRKIPMLRYYNVFNFEQTEGITLPDSMKPKVFNPIQDAEKVIANMPSKPLIANGLQAVYSPTTDKVTMPLREAFNSPESFYCAFFHELVHSTGHASRLNREDLTAKGRFGSETYSREELTAELGAAMLCASVGLSNATEEQSAAYLAGWLEALRNDSKLIVQAAGKAQAATKFILNEEHSDVKTEIVEDTETVETE